MYSDSNDQGFVNILEACRHDQVKQNDLTDE